MKEKKPINTNHVVKHSLEAVVRPWSKLPRQDLAQQIESLTVPVVEIARRAGVSPQKVLADRPGHIEVGGSIFFVKKASTDGNLRMKHLIRKSVREPAIKGMRNGKRRLDEELLKRRVQQARQEREKFTFVSPKPHNQNNRTQRRAEIRAKVAERTLRRIVASQERNEQIHIDNTDIALKTLRSLVHVGSEHIEQIVINALNDPNIHLLDFADMLGLPKEVSLQLEENRQLLGIASPERKDRTEELKRIIDATPLLHPLSKTRIHPATPFENGVPLFFGIGGGSRMPCQGLPLDVLKMVLTGEKLRRELGLSQCTVLGADEITYTNIGRTQGFTKEKVDQVIGTEVAILNEVFRRFGFKNWRAIRQSEVDEHFSEEQAAEWRHNIEEADAVDFVGGHHYAIEMSDIQLLVPNGIKLGWWIRPLARHTGYIMDEQPFHARFALVMALLGKAHATSLLYTHAGSRITLGEDGRLQKEAPYITYTPQRRLLLSPFEDIGRKLAWAERRGGGLALPFVREQMSGMIDLFEELVTKIPANGKTEHEIFSNKLQFIVWEGVGNDSSLAQSWLEAFPNSL